MSNILDQDVMYLPGVGPRRKALMNKEMEVFSFGDLLEYYPYKYIDRSKIYNVSDLRDDMPFVQVKGYFLSFEIFELTARKKRIVAHFSDSTGVVDLVWFTNPDYVVNRYRLDIEYIVFGRPKEFNHRFQFVHPDIDPSSEINLNEMGLQPYYSTTEKMKNNRMDSRAVSKIIKSMLERLPTVIPETLPKYLTSRMNLMSCDEALRTIHYPHNTEDLARARHRLKFEELFFLQLNILRYVKQKRNSFRGYLFPRIANVFNDFYYNHLPFPLTGAQKRVIKEIRTDMGSGKQMNRLLQGDVGSGKTLVALMSMLIAVDNGFQACIMAPTEILAEQHLKTLRDFLGDMPVNVELLTGIIKGKKRKAVLEGLANGSINILVGTHAVIEDPVQFANLGFVVVDEQHRFGVAQRARLWDKSKNPPHVLVMTATPIPRTLAMTIYGDLDVSVIDELPPGRKPVVTLHKYLDNMADVYDGIRKQVYEGRQIYIVYPLIEESEKMDLKNLEEGYVSMCNAFPEFKISKVHGKMKPQEKEEEMIRFVNRETQILVATTVIEVGVNVPNASVMVIIDAERFGLSQLHQLRGRVGRGADQSYCILVTPYKLSDDTRMRMDIMCDTNDGFRIAEADLKLRGPGDLEGTQQSGIAFNLKIAEITSDTELVEMARREAEQVISEDPQCNRADNMMMWQYLDYCRRGNIDWSSIS